MLNPQTLRRNRHWLNPGRAMRRRKFLRGFCALAAVLGVYPAGVLSFTWSHVSRSDFQGGRNGPLDAYRHTLASATVAYTLGEWAVRGVTTLSESQGKDSNRMDIHNNRIGAKIGARAGAFREIEPAVRQAVLNGRVHASDLDQITWLPKDQWRDGRLW